LKNKTFIFPCYLALSLLNPLQMQGFPMPCHNLNQYEVLAMSHVHEEKGVEIIGLVPSIAMVLGGLAVAILPALVQVYLLFAG